MCNGVGGAGGNAGSALGTQATPPRTASLPTGNAGTAASVLQANTVRQDQVQDPRRLSALG
jgi:hypothetical protein